MAKPSRTRTKPTFSPTVHEPLESRELLSSSSLSQIARLAELGSFEAFQARQTPDTVRLQPALWSERPFRSMDRPFPFLKMGPRAAQLPARPFFSTESQVRAGGTAVEVTDVDGDHFLISVLNGGVVRTFPMLGGQVGLIIDGSNPDTIVTVQSLLMPRDERIAHRFSHAMSGQDGLLTIGAIDIPSGQINSILGYHTARLAGPVTVSGTGVVDRIAFQEILPGGSVRVEGILNNLDVLNNATFTGEQNDLFVGRDFNLLTTGGNLVFEDGADFIVGQNLGAVLQPARGTGPSGAPGGEVFVNVSEASGIIEGDLITSPTSAIEVGDFIVRPFLVTGNEFLNGPVNTRAAFDDPLTGDDVNGIITDPGFSFIPVLSLDNVSVDPIP